MLNQVFFRILGMTGVSGLVILVVIGARLLLRKAPKVFSYILWAVVLFRLLCPFAPKTPVSMIPEIPIGGSSAVTESPADSEPQQPENDPRRHVEYLWLAGTGVMLLVSGCRYLKLRRKLIGACPLARNIYIADHISTPFVHGLLFPKIYLPSGLSEKERGYIIAHERHHIRRLDHVWRLLFFLALCLHWFNPLVWLAFILSGRDMEMSCDEAVLRQMGGSIRADYAASLLKLATGRKLSETPVTFSGGNTKERLINMANWKKPKSWSVILSTILCVAVLAGCAVDPAEAPAPSSDDVSNHEVILCTNVDCTDASHDHSLICTVDDCTDPSHDHHASHFSVGTTDPSSIQTVPVEYVTTYTGTHHPEPDHHGKHH
ncbi:MAG: hypothetical protein IJX69_01080 [Oscillospiraceae bacterium]|nr:hypothetical protein [Oscillospiraceae bacterium]